MHPYIHFLGLHIPSYGLMMAIALVTAVLLSYFRTKKVGLDPDLLLNLAIAAILSGIAGAYLLYIFVTYPLKTIWESIIDGSFRVFSGGGLVFYGGLIAGGGAAALYLLKKKQNIWDYAAVIVPTIPLAHAIGRIGCFLSGCCYGKCVDTAISVIYPAYGTGHTALGGAPAGVPVFPVQLIEAGLNIIIFVILIVYTAKSVRSRSAAFLYMTLYGVERFLLEYLRYDEIRGIFLGLSTSQWISIAMIVGGVIGFILLRSHEKKHPANRDGLGEADLAVQNESAPAEAE